MVIIMIMYDNELVIPLISLQKQLVQAINIIYYYYLYIAVYYYMIMAYL